MLTSTLRPMHPEVGNVYIGSSGGLLGRVRRDEGGVDTLTTSVNIDSAGRTR